MGRDSPAFQILAMEADDGGDGLASGGHIHKSEAPGRTTMPVLHHVCRFNLAERFENLAQIVPCDIARQITYINIHFAPLSFDGFIPGPQQSLQPASGFVEAALSVLISRRKAVLKPRVATSTCVSKACQTKRNNSGDGS
jgi:hypothetical protein